MDVSSPTQKVFIPTVFKFDILLLDGPHTAWCSLLMENI